MLQSWGSCKLIRRKLASCNKILNRTLKIQNILMMDQQSLVDGNELAEEKLFSTNPIKLFNHWIDAATETSGFGVSHAMTLATVKPNGRPAARMVMLKGADGNGFRFSTSCEGQKAEDLRTTGYAALVLHWTALSRSVRIEGCVETLPIDTTEEDFRERLFRPMQLAFHLSKKQSTPVENREVLLKELQGIHEKYEGNPVPMPQFYISYIVKPDSIEFWQGHESRFCDRIIFRKKDDAAGEHIREGEDGWVYQRLRP